VAATLHNFEVLQKIEIGENPKQKRTQDSVKKSGTNAFIKATEKQNKLVFKNKENLFGK